MTREELIAREAQFGGSRREYEPFAPGLVIAREGDDLSLCEIPDWLHSLDAATQLAVLEAIREPTPKMLSVPGNYFVRGAGILWRAMIDALIAEVRNDQA